METEFTLLTWEQNREKSPQVNLLTTVLNDAPIQPEDDDEDTASLLKDSPQCVTFGLFMIWYEKVNHVLL